MLAWPISIPVAPVCIESEEPIEFPEALMFSPSPTISQNKGNINRNYVRLSYLVVKTLIQAQFRVHPGDSQYQKWGHGGQLKKYQVGHHFRSKCEADRDETSRKGNLTKKK